VVITPGDSGSNGLVLDPWRNSASSTGGARQDDYPWERCRGIDGDGFEKERPMDHHSKTCWHGEGCRHAPARVAHVTP